MFLFRKLSLLEKSLFEIKHKEEILWKKPLSHRKCDETAENWTGCAILAHNLWCASSSILRASKKELQNIYVRSSDSDLLRHEKDAFGAHEKERGDGFKLRLLLKFHNYQKISKRSQATLSDSFGEEQKEPLNLKNWTFSVFSKWRLFQSQSGFSLKCKR